MGTLKKTLAVTLAAGAILAGGTGIAEAQSVARPTASSTSTQQTNHTIQPLIHAVRSGGLKWNRQYVMQYNFVYMLLNPAAQRVEDARSQAATAAQTQGHSAIDVFYRTNAAKVIAKELYTARIKNNRTAVNQIVNDDLARIRGTVLGNYPAMRVHPPVHTPPAVINVENKLEVAYHAVREERKFTWNASHRAWKKMYADMAINNAYEASKALR